MIALVKHLLGVKAEKGPGFAIRFNRPGDTPVTMNLQNVFLEAGRLSGEERASRLRTAVLGVVPGPRPHSWKEVAPRLRPAVRNPSSTAITGMGLLRRAMLPFVDLAYAIDYEHSMSFVSENDLVAWGVDQVQVEEQAVANLGAEQLQVGRVGSIAVLLGPDGYTSSWLAAPERIRRVASDIGSDVVVVASTRDQVELVDTASHFETVKVLENGLAAYEEEPRRLSPVPYLVRDDGLEVWDPPPGHPAELLVRRAQGVLAAVEYQHQADALNDLFSKAGEDAYVGKFTLIERPDGSVWSWCAWVKQVTNGLLPEAEHIVLGDNSAPDAGFAVRWDDGVRIASDWLVREAGYDPPLWRYHGWPDENTTASLRQRTVPFPPLPS